MCMHYVCTVTLIMYTYNMYVLMGFNKICLWLHNTCAKICIQYDTKTCTKYI